MATTGGGDEDVSRCSSSASESVGVLLSSEVAAGEGGSEKAGE